MNKSIAFTNGRTEKPNKSIHRDTHPSVWAAKDSHPQSTLTCRSVFPPFTNNPTEMSSETFPQGSQILQKGAEKSDKFEGSLQGSAYRYFSFMKEATTSALLPCEKPCAIA